MQKTQELVPLSRKRIVFSSVSVCDRKGLSPAWARILRSTRLVRIECTIRSTLCCMSIRLFEITHSLLTLTRALEIVSGRGDPILIRNSGGSEREFLNSRERF